MLIVPVLAATFALHPIAAPVLRAPASSVQFFPAVAGNGRDFLAARADVRPEPAQQAPQFDTYAVRIGLDGTPSDDVNLFPTSLSDGAPSVVWNGSEYVVVRSVTSPVLYPGAVHFSTIDDDGPRDARLVESAQYDAPPLQSIAARVSVAWNGSEYLVVNESLPVTAFIVDRDFHVVRRSFLISPPAASPPSGGVGNVWAVAVGQSFLVTWLGGDFTNGVRVMAAAVSPAGDVSPPVALSAASPQVSIAVASAGTRALVVWSDRFTVQGRFVGEDAAPLGETFTIAHVDGITVNEPAVAWNGSVFLVAFSFDNDYTDGIGRFSSNLYAVRLSADGVLLDAPYPVTVDDSPGPQTESAIAASGSVFLLVWNAGGHIRCATLGGTPRFASHSLGEESGVAAVFDGGQLAMTWTEADFPVGHPRNTSDSEAMFGRALPDGTLLDGAGISLGHGTSLSITTNGEIDLVVWRGGTNVYAERLSREGERLSTIALPAAPLVASDGRDFLLVWTDLRGIRTGVITASGDLVVNPSPFVSAITPLPTHLAWNGMHYALAYCLSCVPHAVPQVAVQLVDRAGAAVGEPIRLQDARIGALAAGGGRVLATFVQNGVDWLAIVDDAGHLLVTSSSGNTDVRSAVWMGDAFVVTDGTKAQWISTSGQLLGAPVEIAPPSASFLGNVTIAAGRALVTFLGRIEPTAPGTHTAGISRAFFTVKEPPRGRAVRR